MGLLENKGNNAFIFFVTMINIENEISQFLMLDFLSLFIDEFSSSRYDDMTYEKSFWNNDSVSDMYSLENAEEVILQPFIAKMINSWKPKRLLDYGCGYAFLATLINQETEISLFDKSAANQKLLRKKRSNMGFKILNSEEQVQKEHYDCIVLSSVLMCIETKDEIERILRILYDSKTRDGRLIINITHPCFLQYQYGHYHTSFTEKDFDYFKEGVPYKVYMHKENSAPVVFDDYQWTLSTFVNIPLELGFELVEMVEHPDLPFKDNNYNKLACPWIFLIFK